MNKIHLAFLWHNHQPIYKNPTSGIYELPWVRLHACKDYYDTLAILDEFPKIKANFNIVPSLMIQLNDYANGKAHDKYMDLTLKPANDLELDDKVFILHNFFMANWETMIYPYPRYKHLLEKRGEHTSEIDLKRIQNYFKSADFLDLQVWFNLTWMDPYWRKHDPVVAALFAKGENFTEDEKNSLIKKQLEICGLIPQKYKELKERGQIEISVTPFYHPILPLLCDTNNAKKSSAGINLPKKRFQHRKDAKIQIQKAVDYYKDLFGTAPNGMWPSEGSVSDDVIPLFVESGIQWIATDEEILFKTKPEYHNDRKMLFQPYRLSILDNTINIVFRDHGLSDSIGFIYSRWNASHAVNDFINKIHMIKNAIGESNQNHLVSVILDGENCWEYYANDGWDFLRLLYHALSNDPMIETTMINDFINTNPPKETITHLWPGSWINGNYNIWIGHAEDNLAWDYLGETRNFLAEYTLNHPEQAQSPEITLAWENIYKAEGSDWNWWYGDDHSSGNDAMFDYLFRQHLISVYELLHTEPPNYLYKPIKGVIRKNPTLEPIDYISPKIDGKVSSYFEWHPAGFYQVGHAGGSMHQVETTLQSFYYGFDSENLYIRLDLNVSIYDNIVDALLFKILFLSPQEKEVILSITKGEIRSCILQSLEGKEIIEKAAANKIIEIAIPANRLHVRPEENKVEFVIAIEKNGSELERWPYQSSVTIPIVQNKFSLNSWSV